MTFLRSVMTKMFAYQECCYNKDSVPNALPSVRLDDIFAFCVDENVRLSGVLFHIDQLIYKDFAEVKLSCSVLVKKTFVYSIYFSQ